MEVTDPGHRGVLGGGCTPTLSVWACGASCLFARQQSTHVVWTGRVYRSFTVCSPWGQGSPHCPPSWLGTAYTSTVRGKHRSVSFLGCISTQHSPLFPLLGTPFISHCVPTSFFCVRIPPFLVKFLIFPSLCCCLNVQCEYWEMFPHPSLLRPGAAQRFL